jgi:hypothetical protein
MANVIEDSFVQTQFGEAILRVYSAQKGSLMTRGEGNRSPEPFYTEVIVLLAKRDNHLICAIDEYDGTLLDGESRTSESKARIQRFFSGLTVPLNPAFHEKLGAQGRRRSRRPLAAPKGAKNGPNNLWADYWHPTASPERSSIRHPVGCQKTGLRLTMPICLTLRPTNRLSLANSARA